MLENEKSAFVELVSDVLGYYRQPVSTFTLSVWWNACQNYSYEQVSKALNAHAVDPDKGQFAPKVADIIRILAGTKTDRSIIAWGIVHGAMSDVGAYRDVDFGDSAIHATIMDMGGWAKLCRTDLNDLSYTQHKFCEGYRAYLASGASNVPALQGDTNREGWLKKGLKYPEPVRIGNDKAMPQNLSIAA